VRKLRLTGGEPLLRKNLELLIGMLAALRTPDGEPLDITLTTNGSLLARKAQALRDAGLQRVTVSLDALDDAIFRRMNDVDFPVADVLRGIEAAQRVGLAPIKINMVVKRGTNDHEIVPLARHVREHFGPGVVLRFIEYMDVGATNGWRMDEVLPSAQVRAAAAPGLWRCAAGGQRPRRDGRALALCRRRWRDRRHQQRHAGLLPRLQPRPAVHRRQAVPVPVRHAAATTCARCCAAARPTAGRAATSRSPPPSA
jgi:molybdenum cofactor biosynthesis enzyme MoaA